MRIFRVMHAARANADTLVLIVKLAPLWHQTMAQFVTILGSAQAMERCMVRVSVIAFLDLLGKSVMRALQDTMVQPVMHALDSLQVVVHAPDMVSVTGQAHV